ncbi:MAG TPA: hypothetical protein VF210_01230 [Pseudomonadales bacterium]
MNPQKILPFYRNLCAAIGIASDARHFGAAARDTLVPHPLLRRSLENDPAMDAILTSGGAHYALGSFQDAPFMLRAPGLIQLSSTLIFDPAALSAAARWGLEAHHARESSGEKLRLSRLARYGRALIDALDDPSRERLLAVTDPAVRAALLNGIPDRIDDDVLRWLARLVGVDYRPGEPDFVGEPTELCYPMEHILASGGDSRLLIDRRTGSNRYGVPPRPRPEAVHFSSSTASAITDYGFSLCDLLRRDLLAAVSDGSLSEQDARSRLAEAIGQRILGLFGLNGSESDVAITPSGTDSELLAVLVGLAGAGGKPLVNVLIAPDESGTGVRAAASGRWSNDTDAAGVRISKGTAVWPDARIAVREIPIRDPRGRPLPAAAVNRRFLETCRACLAEGHHLLVHVLMSSKTDLYAPDFEAVTELVAERGESIDVVVDACQLRANFQILGELVRKGCMVQVTGSKFLTGPPFSGALLLPASMRSRAPAIADALKRSPAVAALADWLADWRPPPAPSACHRSYGPLFRWLPALIEASLFLELPEDFRLEIASRFRDALLAKMSASRYLHPLTLVEPPTTELAKVIAQHSILSFAVLGKRDSGELSPLNEAECRHLFELLNKDVASLLQPISAVEEALARQPVHIGQPVTLGSAETPTTVLRLVLGARFFTIVGQADTEIAREAALESEIADATRAIAKVELLASYWWRVASNPDAMKPR